MNHNIFKMVKLKNKFQVLFVVSLTILWTQALEINLLNILTDFKCKTNIKVNTTDIGDRIYAGTGLEPMHYQAAYGTSTVIAYIVDETRFEEIANSNAFYERMAIANELGQNSHEMIVLGMENFQHDEFDVIGSFIVDIIKPHPSQMSLRIVTMGEQKFSRIYFHDGIPVEEYRENPFIRGGALQYHLIMVFPTMEYRPKKMDPSNIKEVRFYEHLEHSRPSYSEETRWPIFVENGEYIPASSIVPYLNKMMYNFMKRYRDNEIHLLIVSGKDYNRLKSDSLPWYEELKEIMKEMSRNNETLFLMGCFNFDWSEIDIVPQIIMKHSEIRAMDPYSVSAVGIGMFDTLFENPDKDDTRLLSPTLNGKVKDFIKKYNGGTMMEKTIQICDFNASNVTTMRIRLINGRYVPREKFMNYCFTNQYPDAKFALIIIDSAEMRNRTDFSVTEINQNVRILKNKGIVVLFIKTKNFKLYDLHIIPEWIQRHRGAVHPDQITVSGGGGFDTTFKYVSPKYEVTYTMLNVANEYKEIREAFVNTADDKGIIVANIDTEEFDYTRFPIHSINGFYDRAVLATNEFFRTEGGIKTLFLIMDADKFNRMATAYPSLAPTLITGFRAKIASHYPVPQWTVYLVGLDNFGVKDFHLFAEFVEIHTNDNRPLWEFVHTFGNDIYQTEYEYRDNLPLTTANNMPMADAFTEFFGMIGIISELMD